MLRFRSTYILTYFLGFFNNKTKKIEPDKSQARFLKIPNGLFEKSFAFLMRRILMNKDRSRPEAVETYCEREQNVLLS